MPGGNNFDEIIRSEIEKMELEKQGLEGVEPPNDPSINLSYYPPLSARTAPEIPWMRKMENMRLSGNVDDRRNDTAFDQTVHTLGDFILDPIRRAQYRWRGQGPLSAPDTYPDQTIVDPRLPG